MRPNPDYELDDDRRIRALIRAHPWATLTSHSTSHGLVASHLPVLLEDTPELSVVSHLGRPDDELHELGAHEVLLVIAGPHGYVSPSWYEHPAPAVPTWNFLVAHLYGTPELLTPEENYQVLSGLVDHFEERMPHPHRLEAVEGYAQRIAKGTVGLRLRPTRVVGKAKLSQDKPAAVAHRVIRALETDPHYANPALAQQMRAVYGLEESS